MIDYQFKEQGERLKKIRNNLGLTRKDIADQFSVTENFYGTLEVGRTIPTPHLLFLLANKYDVNINYIINGKEPMFITQNVNYTQISDFDANRLVKEIEILRRENDLLKELLLLRKNNQ